MNWAGLAFVANPGSVALDALPSWVTTLAVQVAHGLTPRDDVDEFVERCYGRYYVAAWAWGNADDVPAEAELHGLLAEGFVAYIANLEEPYDAHGSAQNPDYGHRWTLPAEYLAALPWDGPLGVTTTPQFGSDMTPWRDRGAVYMPQAFPLENFATVASAVEWGQAWGWPIEQQRPLAQCFATHGIRPDPAVMDADAAALGVGLVPYVIEQSTDTDGQAWLAGTRAAVERPTTVPEPEEGTDVSDWTDGAYPGGPMVKVKGFPRPLYPPDAAAKGKRPSVDGPDVEAYKRTVSRAGRWPWQPFDDSFSNSFSHGKTGTEGPQNSGIAGVQRQQKIDATGWVGQKTFNTLRSIRIPDGLPHAGEMAMDAYAAELIGLAWDRFQGSEPAPPAGSIRQLALDWAVGEIGYCESPAGSNRTKYGAWYGMDGQPWCAMFVTWCYERTGSASFAPGDTYAYCPYVVADAYAGRNGLSVTDDPIPGDLVVYDWNGGEYDHIGLFESWAGSAQEFNAIEGNTSTSDNSNGGQVMRRYRNRYQQGTVFVRVAE